MKNDSVKEKNEASTEEVFIPDECGDTMWDAVLKPLPPPERGTLESEALKCFLKSAESKTNC